MTAEAARRRYLADKVSTATPAQLVVMLYDRLGLDIERAATAQAEGDLAAASVASLHAQQVVSELRASLDVSAWSGGDNLAALYQYMLFELIGAKREPAPARLRALGRIVADLRSAWDEAARSLNAPTFAGATREPAVAGAWVG